MSSAAPVPPRKHSAPVTTGRRLSALDTLLQMGLSKSRVEKALASTGGRGVQIAADWLLAHIHDPMLDELLPRHFMLYLCPANGTPLQKQLQTFWDASCTQIGWNAAHNSLPHITLLSGMIVKDGDVDVLLKQVKLVADKFARDFGNHGHFRLEKYISPNFVALFVGKNEELLLRSFIQDLIQELRATPGLSSDEGWLHDAPGHGSSKSYHVTLAYQFEDNHFAGLKDLVEAVDADAGSEWELRLYSCDARLAPKDVSCFKVTCAFQPNQADEMELRVGDFVYVAQQHLSHQHETGWVFGVSWLTGQSGFLPVNHVVRTAEPNAWTLHLSLPLGDLSSVSATVAAAAATASARRPASADQSVSPLLSAASMSSLDRLKDLSHLPPPATCSTPTAGHTNAGSGPALLVQLEDSLTDAGSVRSSSGGQSRRPRSRSMGPPRKMILIRHAERVDFTFGSWIPYSFTKPGAVSGSTRPAYVRRDLNMPYRLPNRRLWPDGFIKDCPLTVVGSLQARLVGEAMKESGVAIRHVYSSPSLRCVQTSHHILQGLGLESSLKIHIEPGLFEWLSWYPDGLPDWMTPDELLSEGYNVDVHYKPYISADELKDLLDQMPPETCEAYYARSFFVTHCVLQKTENLGGNLLLVGHATTLDACSRQLVNGQPRQLDQLLDVVSKIAYCGAVLLQEEDVLPDGRTNHAKRVWKLCPPPFAPVTHCSNARHDWSVLCDDPSSSQ